ncbi:integral membrane protein [Colletotrichum tabaci]|uniref:Integral membrane protein n=1 Tax=Colletotrichum tabaci TaxID=1209068 RepID=A0AAV9TE96_9PEZI
MAAPPPTSASSPPRMPPTVDRLVIFPLEKQIQVSVVAVSIAFIVIPTIMVMMRVLAKRMAHRVVDGSDWCIIAACVFSNALQAVSIVSVIQCGVGLHNTEIIPKYGFGPIIKFLKVLVAQQILWAISLSLCKIAILLLYARIFTTRAMVLAARILAGFTMAWTVVTVLIAFFICRPLSDNWLLDLKGRHCGNQPAADGTMGVLNMMTDVAVLVMPISHLWRLRLEMYKKVALIVTFSLGVFTCIVSALRLYYLAHLEYMDVTFNIPHALIFSALEPGVGITLACIPFLRPLLGRSHYSPKGTANYYTSNGDSARLARSGKSRESSGFVLVEENSSQYQLNDYERKSRSPTPTQVPVIPMPTVPGKVTCSRASSARDSY